MALPAPGLPYMKSPKPTPPDVEDPLQKKGGLVDGLFSKGPRPTPPDVEDPLPQKGPGTNGLGATTGLIQTAMGSGTSTAPLDPANPTGQHVTNANTTTYTPTDMTVDTSKQTVQGQLDSILSKDSPVLQRARTLSQQQANSRGLINSSMAASAGTAAMIDAAVPIAGADANIFNTVASQNKVAKDQAGAAGAAAANSNAQVNAGAANTLDLQNVKGNQALELANVDAANKKDVANIEANYHQLLQTSQDAQQLFSQYSATISQIMTDTNTAAFQKQEAVNKLTGMLQAGLQIIGSISNVDLTSLLDFSQSGGLGGVTGGGTGSGGQPGAGGQPGGGQQGGGQQGGGQQQSVPINPNVDDPSNAPYAGFLNVAQNYLALAPGWTAEANDGGGGQTFYGPDGDPHSRPKFAPLTTLFDYDYGAHGNRGANPNPYFSIDNREQLRGYAMQLGLTADDADRAALQVAQTHYTPNGSLYTEAGPPPENIKDEIAQILYKQSGRT